MNVVTTLVLTRAAAEAFATLEEACTLKKKIFSFD